MNEKQPEGVYPVHSQILCESKTLLFYDEISKVMSILSALQHNSVYLSKGANLS